MFPDLQMDWETASYVATVAPVLASAYWFFKDQRKQRIAELDADLEKNRLEREKNYSLMQGRYAEEKRWYLSEKLKIRRAATCRDNPIPKEEAEEQQAELLRQHQDNLIDIFELSFILLYEENPKTPDPENSKVWSTWNASMDDELHKTEFMRVLPQLLEGEDPDFQAYISGRAGNLKAATHAPHIA